MTALSPAAAAIAVPAGVHGSTAVSVTGVRNRRNLYGSKEPAAYRQVVHQRIHRFGQAHSRGVEPGRGTAPQGLADQWLTPATGAEAAF